MEVFFFLLTCDNRSKTWVFLFGVIRGCLNFVPTPVVCLDLFCDNVQTDETLHSTDILKITSEKQKQVHKLEIHIF